MCESYNRQYGQSHDVDYRSVTPTNLYGPGDNYHPENSHVIPALIGRFHKAKVANVPDVITWGTEAPRREFLYVDVMAAASLFIMQLNGAAYNRQTQSMQSHINVGFCSHFTINELVHAVAEATGYQGRIAFDSSKPDGSPRKWISSERLNAMGWSAKVDLDSGLKMAYQEMPSE